MWEVKRTGRPFVTELVDLRKLNQRWQWGEWKAIQLVPIKNPTSQESMGPGTSGRGSVRKAKRNGEWGTGQYPKEWESLHHSTWSFKQVDWKWSPTMCWGQSTILSKQLDSVCWMLNAGTTASTPLHQTFSPLGFPEHQQPHPGDSGRSLKGPSLRTVTSPGGKTATWVSVKERTQPTVPQEKPQSVCSHTSINIKVSRFCTWDSSQGSSVSERNL